MVLWVDEKYFQWLDSGDEDEEKEEGKIEILIKKIHVFTFH